MKLPQGFIAAIQWTGPARASALNVLEITPGLILFVERRNEKV